MKKKILFITGSINQTTQMHQISTYLCDEFDCYFSQFYGAHPIIRFVLWTGVLENTIMSGRFKQRAEDFMTANNLKNDYRMEHYNNHYDLVVVCNDLVMPMAFRRTKTVFVQEGMVDRMTPLARFIKTFRLPRYFALNTALNGSSNLCDIYCVASEGYKNFFNKMGTDDDKIIVTGIPNFDDAGSFTKNDFPHRDYVMVATSDIREVFGKEDRIGFIKHCVEIANGRPMLFKLHPNELYDRAYSEIMENAPAGTLVFQDGPTNEMIANCTELITQWSTVVYIGLALGKPVHSFFDLEELTRLLPVQNGGRSAEDIAELCRRYIYFKGNGKQFLRQYKNNAANQVDIKEIKSKNNRWASRVAAWLCPFVNI